MAYTDIDDPSAYFQVNLHSGDGGTGQTLTFDGNSDLQLDFHWARCRSEAGREWQVIDTVRGITKGLTTVTTATEYTEAKYVTAIGSDGYSIGQNNDNNKANETYVSYNWKTGTSVSGNTTGSGTAKAYSGSVSTDAGFSIIAYLGNGTAGHTIPHHLGVVPQMIIVKERANANSWYVYHHSLGNAKNLYLNTTHAEQTDGVWNDTTPTSSVFSVSDANAINRNNGTTVAYCFAEKQGYSKFGTYLGNGNNDGTYIHLGFKPAFVMVKKVDATANWSLIDNKRDPFNVTYHFLEPNVSDDEFIPSSPQAAFDFCSQGFKCRSSNGAINSSGHTFLYMAFAENPFVTSTGVPATAR